MRQLTLEDDEIRTLIAGCRKILALPPTTPAGIRWADYLRRSAANQ